MSSPSDRENDIDRTLAVARHYAEDGNVERAQALFHLLLTLQPKNPVILHEYGVAALRAQQGDKAVDLLQRATSLGACPWSYYSNLGVACRMVGRLEDAKAAYRTALRLNPHATACHYNLGNLLRQADEIDEAMKQYRDALSVDPNYHSPRLPLAELLIQQGEVEEARLILANIPAGAREAEDAARMLSGIAR